MIEKRCRTCKQLKSVKLFFKNHHNSDGLDHHCKVCTSTRKKLLAEKRANKPKVKYTRNYKPRPHIDDNDTEIDIKEYEGMSFGMKRLINIPKELLRGVTK
jgi:hypothetical protein